MSRGKLIKGASISSWRDITEINGKFYFRSIIEPIRYRDLLLWSRRTSTNPNRSILVPIAIM